MTELKNAKEKMTVAEFENKIPLNAELKRVRIEKGRVSFGLGYDKEESCAIMWNSNGKAFIRPLTKKAMELVRFRHTGAIRFNGWLYHREKKFDLVDGNTEK